MIGDGIIDEYCYVTPLGKSSKETIIATRATEVESFLGGVWAAGAHVKSFCQSVDIATAPSFTIKRRYVDKERFRKLFEVHHEKKTGAQLDEPEFSSYDLVIVTDFGHGAIKPEMIQKLCDGSKFLAVNAQTNSANHGFNLITKYPFADYVVVDELEARLAVHDRESTIETVIEKLPFKKIAVTLGPNGSIGFDGEFYREKANAKQIVDTMGAGDAFFCVTAPLAAAGCGMQELLKVGNAAGAIKCGVVGHRTAVTREALEAQLGLVK